MNKQLLTVVATTFNNGRKLRIFLDTMLEQHGAEELWHCIILHDGCPSSQDVTARESALVARSIVRSYTEAYPTKFSYYENAERANCYGHDLRAKGLEMTTTPYIHITNADNIYCYGWLERVLPAAVAGDFDLVTWNISHSYKEFHLFSPELRGGHIDFCNYMMKTSLAEEIGFPWRHFEADGAHIEEFVRRFPDAKILHMPAVFATHN